MQSTDSVTEGSAVYNWRFIYSLRGSLDMKRKHILTGLAFAAAAIFPVAAYSQFGSQLSSFVSVGSSTLPSGQYLMCNLATGQSLFVVINGQGQMVGQDPRALQVSLNSSGGGGGLLPGAQGGGIAPAAGGGGFGGILKQGLDTFIQNRNSAPAQ